MEMCDLVKRHDIVHVNRTRKCAPNYAILCTGEGTLKKSSLNRLPSIIFVNIFVN